MPTTPPTTELIARGLLVRAGHVLLCRSVKHGYLYLPGGHIEFGEAAAAALAREFAEETGLPILVRDLLLVTEGRFDVKGRTHHEINLVFHVEPPPDDLPPPAHDDPDPLPPVPSLEPKIAFDWIDLAAAVDLDIRPTAVRAWLATLGQTRTPPTAEWASEIRPPASTSPAP